MTKLELAALDLHYSVAFTEMENKRRKKSTEFSNKVTKYNWIEGQQIRLTLATP